MFQKKLPWFALLLGAGTFILGVARLQTIPLRFAYVELATALPKVMQVALSGGDRFLAANVDVFRVLTFSGIAPSPAKIHVQGQVQADAAWLNPAHEDNYYMATAVLPWNNEFQAGDTILARATDARPYDFAPPFFRGFNHFYFRHDPLTGAAYMKLAAERTAAEGNKQALEAMAIRWTEKGSTPEDALNLLLGMQRTTRSASVRSYLEERIDSLRALVRLREAAAQYRHQYGRSPLRLSDLVGAKLIQRIPADPPGRKFTLDNEGMPVLVPLTPVSQPKP